MALFDAITGGAAKTAYKNNIQTINTGLNQQTTALGDNATSANNYLLGQGLNALGQGYSTANTNLGTGFDMSRTDLGNGYGAGQGALGQGYGQAQDAINAGYAAAQGALGAGYGQGRSDLQGQYGLANDYLQSQYGQARSDISSGYGQARADLTAQYSPTQGYLQGISTGYAPLVAQTAASVPEYMNAIGGNGASGSAQALQAFQQAPGYAYQQDQALGAIQRSAAARGGLAGGNATSDILSTANGLAAQGYQQYVNNLQTAVGMNTTGLAGQAQGLALQGNASQNYGNALASLGTQQGGQLANISTGLGNQLASNSQNLGNQLNANATGLANAQGNAFIGQGGALGGLYQNMGTALNTSNVGLGSGLSSLDSGFGSGMANLATSQGSNTLGVYGQAGANLMNLGNQESNAIGNATKMYVDNSNTEAKNQMAASSNLLGALGGLGQSFIDGGGISGFAKLFK
ncbi:hypothetical protein MKK67_11560 [Methylobacterium sp. J-072]|uniref:hypothetical protein n=1 Tax=Methylobacterium sp. J-072 TaxID=2836651 RepID=UPI001FB8F910|nr:hypothetical protein [Methylobacterium sp. J-072]MCJ2093128.1 hypothetical protein [Methylobacterium sp. J-072]